MKCPSCGAHLYADGGEVEEADPSDFPKKDHDLPDYKLDGYRGEEETPSNPRGRYASQNDSEDEDQENKAALAMALKRKRRGW